MRFLANENIPRQSVALMRAAGHDVLSMSEDAPGSDDETVLRRAVQERRIVLTFDRDYGELIYRRGEPAPPGVVYLRFVPAGPDEPALRIVAACAQLTLNGYFTVLEHGYARQRPLPRHGSAP